MPPKWSHTRTAVNRGWGIPEELALRPLTGKRTKRLTKKINGSGYTSAALDGYGYTSAALEGYGYGDDMVQLASNMSSEIGQAAMGAIKSIASKYQVSLLELLKNPDRLINLVQKYAPGILKRVVNFFKKVFSRDKKSVEKEQMRQRLAWLKQYDPESYKRVYKQLQKKAWEDYQLAQRAMFVGDNENETPYLNQVENL